MRIIRIIIKKYWYTFKFLYSSNKQAAVRKRSLSAHNTKARILNEAENDYLPEYVMYIHQNPTIAGLVVKIEDWEYSSYPVREGPLINKKLAFEMLNMDATDIATIKIS